MWIAADFECMNVLLEAANETDSIEKLFVHKQVAKKLM